MTFDAVADMDSTDLVAEPEPVDVSGDPVAEPEPAELSGDLSSGDADDGATDTAADFELDTQLQVQEAADALSNMSEIRPENWESLEPDERLGVLQDIENQMAEVQHRPPVPVTAEPMRAGTFGGFNGEAIALNSDHLDSEMPAEEFVDTIVHEGRHAYQDHAIRNPGAVADPAVEAAWAENQETYFSAEEYGQEFYQSQPLEADAWSYAGQVVSAMRKA